MKKIVYLVFCLSLPFYLSGCPGLFDLGASTAKKKIVIEPVALPEIDGDIDGVGHKPDVELEVASN